MQWNTIWLISAGWLVGIVITAVILFLYYLNVEYVDLIFIFLGGELTGLVVGVWTLWALRKSIKPSMNAEEQAAP
jgi:hypothetical protein